MRIRGGRPLLGAALLLCLAASWLAVGWIYPLTAPRGSGPLIRLFAGDREIGVLQGTGNRAQVWLPLAEIPPVVVDAVLAAEDRRFYSHLGIDPRAVLRAAFANVRSGGIQQGASTITQQLARTLYLPTARSWGRKLRESAIAVLLELRYTKAQILEAYLNAVYLGHAGDVAVHGVAAAAQQFLGKPLREVRVDEAAILAAAINAPSRVFAGNRERVRRSRDRVLWAMYDWGSLEAEALQAALQRSVRVMAVGGASRASYFRDLLREEIHTRLALPSSGELRLATSLDPALQRAAERAVGAGIVRVAARRGTENPGAIQAALVAIEPATGKIRALVGGHDYQKSPFNRATKAARQPGSLFKPFVYLAAFEAEREGAGPAITPASLIRDEPVTIRAGRRTWAPRNLDRRFHGPVTVRRALGDSLNVPAVRVAQDVGLERVARVARATGIASPLAVVPSLALGTSTVTLLEITSAFATLANQGLQVTPTTLAPLQSAETERLLAPPPPTVRAVSAESAYLVTHLLRGAMRDGTARGSGSWGLSDLAAGKTGTTDDLRDAWFVGYVPDLVVGVWVGRDDNGSLGFTGAQAALPTEAFRAGTVPAEACEAPAIARAGAGFLGWLRSLLD